MQIFHAIRYNSVRSSAPDLYMHIYIHLRNSPPAANKPPQLSIGYHMRKASMLDTPEWLAVTAKAAKVDPYVALQDICICIPRLLERSDRLASAPADAAAVSSVIADSQALAARGFEWLSTFEKPGARYDEVSVERMQGILAVCADRVFDTVFEFHYFGAGICYMIYWMSMLILQSNTFALLRRHRALDVKQLVTWDRQLQGYADSICRSVPFHLQPMTGYTAKFGSLTPLIVARKYYEAKGAKRQADWCAAVYTGSRVPGLYSEPVPLEPFKEVRQTVGNSDRFI
jgi:hypothetical protein